MKTKDIIRHHVIITKHGEDVYIDETERKDKYSMEIIKLEKVITITGNCTGQGVTLTIEEAHELRRVLNDILIKEEYLK